MGDKKLVQGTKIFKKACKYTKNIPVPSFFNKSMIYAAFPCQEVMVFPPQSRGANRLLAPAPPPDWSLSFAEGPVTCHSSLLYV